MSEHDGFSEILDKIMHNHKKGMYTQLPCRITSVNANGTVNIEAYNNGKPEELPNVPVRHTETESAFIFLGLKTGDRGVVRFFDCINDAYKTTGIIAEHPDKRTNDINDGLFEMGFYPLKSAYAFPVGNEIAIGLKNGTAILSFSPSGELLIRATNVGISGTNINITAENVAITGSNLTLNGTAWDTHQHSNGNLGSPTGGVL